MPKHGPNGRIKRSANGQMLEEGCDCDLATCYGKLSGTPFNFILLAACLDWLKSHEVLEQLQMNSSPFQPPSCGPFQCRLRLNNQDWV